MKRFFRLVRRFIIFALLLGIIAITGVMYYMEFELPDIEALNTVQLQVPLQIFTHDGKLIATFGEKRRIPLPYDQIPKPLIQAVLATEDQRYYQHSGVDLQGLGRAALQLLLTGRKSQGGSTITMQIARNFYLTSQKTFGRKLREILYAIKIEHTLSKEKILELYMNKIFFGNRAYGAAAAAEVYYGKHLNELTLDQYAMLAGLPKAPSKLNPIADPDAALKRRDHVLERMYDLGYITKAAYKNAIKEPVDAHYHDLQAEVKAPYVAELVRQQLEQMYGDSIYTDGFKVYTTINSDLQMAANQSVRDNLLAYDERHGYRGPLENLGEPSLDTMQEWEQTLSQKPVVNGLEPAAVVEMTRQTATVLRANGTLTIIPWSGLSWARKQINPDYLGPTPSQTRQILKLGDVVLIASSPEGYRLAQIPKAEAGLVALNPQNGAILAMTGGFDYQTSSFNRITSALRQPGSSFKPFIYSAALEKGFTLATVINDAPIVIENTTDNSLWRPQNDTHKFYGPTRLRTAIIESRNLVSIRLLALMGMPYSTDYLKRFGFVRSQLPPGLSLALGTAMVTPLQMAQAYAVFANSGFKVVPYAIDSIHNSQDEIIYQAKPLVACDTDCAANEAAASRVISKDNAFLITSALHDVIQRGTAKLAKNLGRSDLAGKTGTTQNQVDAWFAGYNPDLVAVAWVGFDQQQQSLHEYGNAAALPMWMQFIQHALKDKPEHPMPQPPGVLSIKIDPRTGKQAPEEADGMFEYFMQPYLPEAEAANPTTMGPETASATNDETKPSANAALTPPPSLAPVPAAAPSAGTNAPAPNSGPETAPPNTDTPPPTPNAESGGLGTLSFKSAMAAILSFSSAQNGLIHDAVKLLRDVDINTDDAVVKLQVSFATWAPEGNVRLLRTRTAELAKAIEGWGTCEVSEVSGDVFAGVASSLLGFAANSIATPSIAPLTDVVYMLPFTRPASAWYYGAVLLRSPDGKPWPYQPGSAQQTTWIDLMYARPGSGKSVLSNAINLALCLSGGITRLPRIAIVDIGPSSSGLISLLKEALPPDVRHFVAYHRLRMTPEYSINPFDTQLGCRKPSPQERGFLVNFVTLLATPLGAERPYDGVSDMAGLVVDEMYKYLADEGKAHPYTHGLETIIDDILSEIGFVFDDRTTWWEVTDALFLAGFHHEAMLAQRYAMPLLADAAAICRTQVIEDLYGQVRAPTGEPLIQAFSRMISSAVREYPILSNITKFDIGDARIVSLDLDEVAKSGGDAAERQTAVMYMLARYSLARHFYLTEDTLTDIPDSYRDFHRARISEIREDSKRIVYDEFHRTSKARAVRDQVILDMREGRKWNVQIALISQSLDDFDAVMVEFGTSIFIMDAGPEQAIRRSTEIFGLSETARMALKTRVHGPREGGATFLAQFATKHGLNTQLLTNTLGPIELWAFSTTAEDARLRNKLYLKLGPKEARRVLANLFSSGSVKSLIEARLAQLKETQGMIEEGSGLSMADQLMEEILVAYSKNPDVKSLPK